MEDNECVQFLQWALPRLHLRWEGFRRVRVQVCKRVARRMRQLGLKSARDYRSYLQAYPHEWNELDALSRVTISRFYRDKAVFALLENEVLPGLAQQVENQGQDLLRIWSIGCCSGEESYTIAIIWKLRLQPQFPHIRVEVVATDVDANMIRRAKSACYSYSSIKDLPVEWHKQLFNQRDQLFYLKPEYKSGVRFIEQDVRTTTPGGMFDLVACRNLVFTYFGEQQQRKACDRIGAVLRSGGALVIGIHEDLPEGAAGFEVGFERLRIFRKQAATSRSKMAMS